MKTLRLILLATSVLLLNTAYTQTIRIADNNVVRPTGANVYSTLQAAIDAAQPDDIVYITPSNISYGDVTLAKRIILQGVGFNTGLGDRTSAVGTINLTSSTDGINSVTGSTLRGFNAQNIYFTADGIGSHIFDSIIFDEIVCVGIANSAFGIVANRKINNLTIRNCQIGSISFTTSQGGNNGLSNSNFHNSVFTSTINISDVWGTNGTLNNTISNSLIFYVGNPLTFYTAGSANNTLFLNNVFSGAGNLFGSVEGATFANNIFYGLTPSTSGSGTTFRDNTFSNNLITSTFTMPPPANGGGTNNGLGNLTGVSPAFVSVAGTTWVATYDYSLNTGSPAKNAGTDGTDIGPTGGAYPINKNIVFRPSALPLITELNTSGVVPQNQPLKANLKAKSN